MVFVHFSLKIKQKRKIIAIYSNYPTMNKNWMQLLTACKTDDEFSMNYLISLFHSHVIPRRWPATIVDVFYVLAALLKIEWTGEKHRKKLGLKTINRLQRSNFHLFSARPVFIFQSRSIVKMRCMILICKINDGSWFYCLKPNAISTHRCETKLESPQ